MGNANTISITIGLNGQKEVEYGLNGVMHSMERMAGSVAGKVKSLAVDFAYLYGISKAMQALFSVPMKGLEFSREMETARLGIASIITATQDLINEDGKRLAGMEKFNESQKIARDLMKELQIAGLETTATTEQLVVGFQQLLGPASSAGFTLSQTKDMTVMMVQAMGALGIHMNQLSAEGRSLLDGSIIPTQDRLAVALGITGEMVKKWKEQGVLYDELSKRLEPFKLAGGELANTWSGLLSNIKEAIAFVGGEMTGGIFEKLKSGYKEILALLIDTQRFDIGAGIKTLFSGVKSVASDIGSVLFNGISGFIEKLKEANNYAGLHKAEIKDIYSVFGSILSQLWEIVRQAGSFLVLLSKWTFESGVFMAALTTINTALAAAGDVISWLIMGIKTVAFALANTVLSPLASLFDMLGKAADFVKPGWGDSLTGIADQYRNAVVAAGDAVLEQSKMYENGIAPYTMMALNHQKGIEVSLKNQNAESAKFAGILKSLFGASQGEDKAKKIENLNKKIQEEIAKLTMTEIEHIHHRAAEYAKEGADKAKVAQWTTAQLAKYWAEYDEKSQERIKKAYEEEQKLADKLVLLNLQTKNKLFDLEAAHQTKVLEWNAKAGLINEEILLGKKNELQVQALQNKQSELSLTLQQLGYIEEMLFPSEKMLELLKDREIITRQIKNTEESLIFDVLDIHIAKQKELNDLLKNQADYRKKGYDDIWTQMMDMANQVGGEAGQGLGKLGSSIKGIADIGMGNDPASQRYQAALNEWNAIKALSEQGYIDEFTQLQTYNQMKLAEEQMYTQQRLAITSNSFGAMAGMAQAFYALSGNQSKAAFNAYKAFAIAQATIDTYTMAVGAYKQAMGLPPPFGQAMAPIWAGMAIAFGMARIAAIASQQPGAGASTAATPSGGGGYSYNTPTTNTWAATETKQSERPMVVNIHLSGGVDSKDVIISGILKTLKSDNLNASVAHSGWLVGSAPAVVRSVPSYIYDTAPRLHNGYDPNGYDPVRPPDRTMRTGEYPAILEQGEIVVSNKVPASIRNLVREIIYSDTTRQQSILRMKDSIISYDTAPRLHNGYDPNGYDPVRTPACADRPDRTMRTGEYPAGHDGKTVNIVNHFHIAGHVVDHDSFAREIIPSIQKAVEDNMRIQ